MRAEVRLLLVVGLCGGGCGGQLGGGDPTNEAAVKSSPAVTTSDPSGQSSTSSSTTIDFSANNDFFHVFGTNGRTCGTCHKVDQGWTFTPAAASTLPGSDPLFVLDGSNCLPPGQT